ncbi:MAG TPA: hypothetical protein VI094_24180 [Propionibacteriaceae bacterium]
MLGRRSAGVLQRLLFLVAAITISLKQPEIDMMNAWLETWGRIQMPEGSHHSSSDGTMTEEQMQT